MSKIFFITSTGTDIGKTFILEKLCQQLKKDGQKFSAIKPLISGFTDNDPDSDSAKILNALGKNLTKENLDIISPWRFKAALSPNIAAELEGKEINFDEVVSFCQKHIKQAQENDEYLLIEGAGGIMSPVNNHKTFCDLIKALEIPVILVIGNYLGTISHSLTAIKTMQSADIKISQIILNHRADDALDYRDNLKNLRHFTDLGVRTII